MRNVQVIELYCVPELAPARNIRLLLWDLAAGSNAPLVPSKQPLQERPVVDNADSDLDLPILSNLQWTYAAVKDSFQGHALALALALTFKVTPSPTPKVTPSPMPTIVKGMQGQEVQEVHVSSGTSCLHLHSNVRTTCMGLKPMPLPAYPSKRH
jgi:hypothetical protein